MSNTNVEKLLALKAQHPELPIVPLVNSEIVADDGYCRWLGAWGDAYVTEYLRGEERYYQRDDDDIEEVLSDTIGYDAFEAMSDEEAKEAYRALPWVKVIAVNIDLPEEG